MTERKRLETGPYQHTPDDWPGVFIRGDEAYHHAANLRRLLDKMRGGPHGAVMIEPPDILGQELLAGLIDILESCRVRP